MKEQGNSMCFLTDNDKKKQKNLNLKPPNLNESQCVFQTCNSSYHGKSSEMHFRQQNIKILH